MTVSEATDRRQEALRELYELGVLSFAELRAELAAERDHDRDEGQARP